MKGSKKPSRGWLARLPLWGAGLLSLGLMLGLSFGVLIVLEHTDIAAWLGISGLSGWRKILLAAGVVTLIAAVIGLVVSYRKQRDAEDSKINAEDDKLNTDFANAAAQLGGESASVRIAGVYAMVALADRSPKLRQQCIDVLYGHLRIPYEPVLGRSNVFSQTVTHHASSRTHTDTFQQVPGEREVRLSIIRVIREHLQHDAANSWSDCDFDFTGAVFDGGDLSGAQFTNGTISFKQAEFISDTTSFKGAAFSGGTLSFDDAKFSGGAVIFDGAEFSGGSVSFKEAEFTDGRVSFHRAGFSGGNLIFDRATFADGLVHFDRGTFSDGSVSFEDAKFSGGAVFFDGAEFTGGNVTFSGATFAAGLVHFTGTEFSGGSVSFEATFSEGSVSFDGAGFSGGQVSFLCAKFSGGVVDLSNVKEWRRPPILPEPIPEGLRLPPGMNDHQ